VRYDRRRFPGCSRSLVKGFYRLIDFGAGGDAERQMVMGKEFLFEPQETLDLVRAAYRDRKQIVLWLVIHGKHVPFHHEFEREHFFAKG
jgi:hypothetical protein